jgi:valyl-tRNA synthetase
VHTAPWPDASGLRSIADDGNPLVFEVAAAALGDVRKAKTEAKRSLKWPVERIVVRDHEARVRALQAAIDDVRDAANAADATTEVAAEATIEVTLASEPDLA